jgi:hypothetical protein
MTSSSLERSCFFYFEIVAEATIGSICFEELGDNVRQGNCEAISLYERLFIKAWRLG